MNLPLADLITLSRIVVTPLIVFFLWQNTAQAMIFAIILFSFACFTDYLDGLVARITNETSFGAVLDHTADKFLIVVLLLSISFLGILNPIDTIPVGVMIARDILLSGVRELAATRKKTLKADMLGKTKTVLQMFAMLLILLSFFNKNLYSIGSFLIWIASALSLISCLNYIKTYRKLMMG